MASSRAFRELTFQVAMRMGASVARQAGRAELTDGGGDSAISRRRRDVRARLRGAGRCAGTEHGPAPIPQLQPLVAPQLRHL